MADTTGWSTEGATINGKSVTAGTNFRDAVVTEAQAQHYTRFRVFVDGAEIDVKDAPTTLSAGMVVEVRPFDKAG